MHGSKCKKKKNLQVCVLKPSERIFNSQANMLGYNMLKVLDLFQQPNAKVQTREINNLVNKLSGRVLQCTFFQRRSRERDGRFCRRVGPTHKAYFPYITMLSRSVLLTILGCEKFLNASPLSLCMLFVCFIFLKVLRLFHGRLCLHEILRGFHHGKGRCSFLGRRPSAITRQLPEHCLSTVQFPFSDFGPHVCAYSGWSSCLGIGDTCAVSPVCKTLDFQHRPFSRPRKEQTWQCTQHMCTLSKLIAE
jgi:hypothetical protein